MAADPEIMLGGGLPSAAFLVEHLQQFVGCQLDLFVVELGGAVVAGDEAGAVQAAEVAEPERVEVLRLFGCSDFRPRCHAPYSSQVWDFKYVY